jgi:hypothetical protein
MKKRTTWKHRVLYGAILLANWPLRTGAAVVVLLLAAWALAGCSTTSQVHEVKVPVPVECREKVPPRPAMPTESLRPGTGLTEGAKAMMAEIELREGYEARLVTALEACTRPIAPLEGARRGQ